MSASRNSIAKSAPISILKPPNSGKQVSTPAKRNMPRAAHSVTQQS